jgi:hypothetical protein
MTITLLATIVAVSCTIAAGIAPFLEGTGHIARKDDR